MGLRGQQLTVNYAYRQFADEIEDQIMQGTLKPGERLPGEIALAEMFGVTGDPLPFDDQFAQVWSLCHAHGALYAGTKPANSQP